MGQQSRQMHINLFMMGVGHHEAAWRHPDTDPMQVTNIRHFQKLAQIAEDAKFNSVFLADGLATWNRAGHSVLGGLEPFTLLSALASVTERIGLIGTVSTTYNEPFHVARKFASLDHISNGRAGWNIVTSASDAEAYNFGLEGQIEHSLRYERAREFLEVVTSLWDSWEDDARVEDKISGLYADVSKVHTVDHKGKWFSVQGPLNVPRPVQGYPLLVQAGSSEDGKGFASEYAEAIFTAQQTLAEAQAFYRDVKARAERAGRDPDGVIILPGYSVTLGASKDEALEKEAQLHDLANPQRAVTMLSYFLNLELSEADLDKPLPDLDIRTDTLVGHQSRVQLILDLARRERLTLRQLHRRLAGARGHHTFAGTALEVADELEEWFTQGAADGFNLMPPYLPGALNDFVDQVLPILQKRGLFRTEYSGSTLREHYGLARPSNKFHRLISHEIAVA